MKDQYCFPQTSSPDPNFRREGGLTFRQMAALAIWPSLAEAALKASMLDTTQDSEALEIIANADRAAWQYADAFIAAEKP